MKRYSHFPLGIFPGLLLVVLVINSPEIRAERGLKSVVVGNIPKTLSYVSTLADESLLKAWGYQNTKKKYYDPKLCTPDKRRPLNIEIQAIRAVPGKGGHACPGCRFSLIRETFFNEQFAFMRYNFMKRKGLVSRGTREMKACGLRGFFIVGKRVYILHTDAPSYMPELNRLLPLFEKYIGNQPVSRPNRK